jgi:hypothetical protein
LKLDSVIWYGADDTMPEVVRTAFSAIPIVVLAVVEVVVLVVVEDVELVLVEVVVVVADVLLVVEVLLLVVVVESPWSLPLTTETVPPLPLAVYIVSVLEFTAR